MKTHRQRHEGETQTQKNIMNNDLATIMESYPLGSVLIAALISYLLFISLPAKSKTKIWLYSFSIFLTLFWIIELIPMATSISNINLNAIIPLSVSILTISTIGFFLSLTIIPKRKKNIKKIEADIPKENKIKEDVKTPNMEERMQDWKE